MNPFRSADFRRTSFLIAIALLAGCNGTPIAVEKSARRDAAEVGRSYRPEGARPRLPSLNPESPATDYLRFALLNHPQVEAAFNEWRASIEAITSARSLPDPQLTLQADFVHAVTSFMPGAMFPFMTLGKRTAMGGEAAAASHVSYRAYVTALVGAASDLRKAWIDLTYIADAAAHRREALVIVGQSLAIAQAEYTTGIGMRTLETQTRWLNESAKLKSEIASLDDQRVATRARFKAAMGLGRGDMDPPWPAHPLPSAPLADEDVLWQQVLAANPEIGAMHAIVEMAVASEAVARRTKTPDATIGLMADLKMDPLLFRTLDAMTLPIWRDKNAAVIAGANARRAAAEGRLSAEQVILASKLANALFMARDSDRVEVYIKNVALPNTIMAAASSDASYESGVGAFGPWMELRLMEVDLRFELAGARRDRETALNDICSLVAGGLPTADLLADATPSR